MNKKFFLAVILLLALSVFAGCSQTKNFKEVTDDFEFFYIEYLEMRKQGQTAYAIENYLHYEDPEGAQYAMENMIPILDYEIYGWTKLSDSLWAVSSMIKNKESPDGESGYNFVGIIDGRYWVMAGIRQIPEELKAGLDLSQFTSGLNIP